MLCLASVQSIAFAGSIVAPSKVAPSMVIGTKAGTKASTEFAYGLPGAANILGEVRALPLAHRARTAMSY